MTKGTEINKRGKKLNEISFIKLAYRLDKLNIIRYFDLWLALLSTPQSFGLDLLIPIHFSWKSGRAIGRARSPASVVKKNKRDNQHLHAKELTYQQSDKKKKKHTQHRRQTFNTQTIAYRSVNERWKTIEWERENKSNAKRQTKVKTTITITLTNARKKKQTYNVRIDRIGDLFIAIIMVLLSPLASSYQFQMFTLSPSLYLCACSFRFRSKYERDSHARVIKN